VVITFILAMTLYPDVQRKAQAEIDQMVGNSRLPNFSDEGVLPYVQAIVKEALRWHPVAPLCGFLCVASIISPVTGFIYSHPTQGYGE
jgi:cytochrome P450